MSPSAEPMSNYKYSSWCILLRLPTERTMLLPNDILVNAVSSNAFGGIPFTVDGSTNVLSADRPENVVPMSVLVTPSLSMTAIYVKSDNMLLSPKMSSNADSPGKVN